MARLLKIPKVAQTLGVSEKTVRRYIKAGVLPSVFVGNAYRVAEEDVEEYLHRAKVEVGGNTPKGQAPPQLELEEQRGASEEQRGAELDIVLAQKLQQQLDTQLRVLKERRRIARHEEDLHEAEKGFHHWWLFTFDWLSTILHNLPEAAGPQLEGAVGRASQAHRDEVTQGAPNPRNTPDATELLQEWSVRQDADV